MTHSPWLYWFLAVICFIALYAFTGFVVNRLFFELWMKRTNSVVSQGYVFGPLYVSVPTMVFLLVSLLVYAVATYLGQVGYAFAWYAIVAATDIFASPIGLFQIGPSGEPRPMSPRVQKDLLYIDLVMDALIAGLAVGATYLFLNAVVLA